MSKISDDLFWSFPKILLKITSRKFLTTFFQSFLPISTSSLSFPSEHLSRCPPYPGCRSSLFTHLPLLFPHLPVHFFRKLRRWMPPAACSGPSHPPHATEQLCHDLVPLSQKDPDPDVL